jgi:hypothetical protein
VTVTVRLPDGTELPGDAVEIRIKDEGKGGVRNCSATTFVRDRDDLYRLVYRRDP